MQSMRESAMSFDLNALIEFRLRKDVPGRELTTFALGGIVRAVVEPSSIEELSKLLQILKNSEVPWRVIGAGSNLLIPDAGLDQVLIRLNRAFSQNSTIETREGSKLFFASESLMGLSRKTAEEGLSGLEFAAGIPAALGGAVVMNAGAHGSSISEIAKRVHLINAEGELVSYSNSEMSFGYRKSRIIKDEIVVAAEFELVLMNKDEILEKRAACLDYRKQTQPLHLPSAGSVFKNPSDHELAAAQMIESLGLKGFIYGGVRISDMHANWIVKDSVDAKASEVSYLIDYLAEKVFKEFGVELIPEIIRC